MKIAAIYARKSKLTEKGDSIENQIKLCKQYLANLGITDYIIYKDEGFSGKNTDRPKFIEMMRNAKEHKFNVLICYKLDRISRNVSDFSSLVDILDKLDISFISVNEQFDTSSAMGRAMMLICSVFAQLERETISIRVRDNMYALAETGRWLGGDTPTGFEAKRTTFIDDKGKEREYSTLSPIEDEVKLIKLIYSKYLELGSLSKLQKYLLSSNIKTKHGNDWSKSGLSSIIKNPAYVMADEDVINYFKAKGISISGEADGVHGILVFNKRKGKNGSMKTIDNWIYSIGFHDGIIPSKTWLQAQRLCEENKDKSPSLGTSHEALLTGLLKCAKCGANMRVAYGQLDKTKNKKRFYYMCTMKHNSGGTRCNNRNIKGLELDELVLNIIKELPIDKLTLIHELENYKNSIETSLEDKELITINNMIEKNNILIQNLMTNISLTTDETIVKMFIDKISNIKNENAILIFKVQALNENCTNKKYSKIIPTFILQNLSSFIDGCPIDDKRKLISSVIYKIYADGDTGDITVKFKGVENS